MAGHRIAIVVTPLLAIATLAVGMRVGASHAVHAAVVYGAPHARGARAFAWQLVTLVSDTGGTEIEPRTGLTVSARVPSSGQSASWHGDTNEDGVAEVQLDLPGVDRGTPIDLSVTSEGATEPLAEGRVAWDNTAWKNATPGPFLRSSKHAGAIALDVVILGGKLVARDEVPLLVRATSRDDGHPVPNVAISPEPEPGLDVRQSSVTTCALGWARLDVSPKIYVASLGLRAKVADGRTGEWFSGLPVATGSIRSTVPDVVKSDGLALTVQGKTGVYAEIDDDEGRAFAAWAKLPDATGDRAVLRPPALSPGLKWLVTSGEPRGGEIPDEATLLRPFLVAGAPAPLGSPETDDSCAVTAYLALHPAGGFHRATLLDGFVARRGANGTRRTWGLGIGLGALGVGALLELVLLLQTARRGRKLAPDASLGIEDAAALMKRSSAGSVAVGGVLALLGFALIAALLLLRS